MKKYIFLIVLIICSQSCDSDSDKIYYWNIADDTVVCQIGSEANQKITKFLYNMYSNKTKGQSSFSVIEPRNNGNAIHFYSSAHNCWILRSSDDIKYVQLDYPISWVSQSGKILAWWDGDNKNIVFPKGETIDMSHLEYTNRNLMYFESSGQYFALQRDRETVEIYEYRNLSKLITFSHPKNIFYISLRLYFFNDILYCIYTSYPSSNNNNLGEGQELVVNKVNLTEKNTDYSVMYLSDTADQKIFNPFCIDFHTERELLFLIDSTSLKDPPLLRTGSRYYMWDLSNGNVKYLSNFKGFPLAAPLVLNKSLLYDLALNVNIELKHVGDL